MLNIPLLNEICEAGGARILLAYHNINPSIFKKAFVYDRWVGSYLRVSFYFYKNNTFKEFLKIVFLIRSAGFYIDKSVVIKYSLNGILVLDYLNSISIKIIDGVHESEFLTNENISKELYPSLCLKGTENKIYKNYFIYKSRLLKSSWKYNLSKWNFIEELIYSKLLNKNCGKSNYNIILIGDYLRFISDEVDGCINDDYAYFKENIISIKYQFHDALQILYSNKILNQPSIRKFSHGDVMPSNVIIEEGEPLLIDWANGGYLNFLYDYSIKYIYNPELYASTNILELISGKNKIIEYFSKFYFDITKIKLSEENFRIHILISVMEFAIKNFKRHQNIESIHDGQEVLALAESCLAKIIYSLNTQH